MIPIEYVLFLTPSGYSQAAQDMVLAAEESGLFDVRVALFHSRHHPDSISEDRMRLITKLINKPRNASAIQIFHCVPPLQQKTPRLKRTMGFATFETYDPPHEWIKILNRHQAIICPSKFNQNIFSEADIKPVIHHIPHCVDIHSFSPDVKPMIKRNQFTFLFFGSWKERKGWRVLLESWWQEFKKEDHVRLVMKTDRKGDVEGDIARLAREVGVNLYHAAPVAVDTHTYNDKELPSYFKSFDCLILPTMGEGFGLPPLQAMAVGVPVIVTACTGCLDYVNENTCFPIYPDGLVYKRNMDGIVQFANKKWNYITVKNVAQIMRSVLNNPSHADEKSKNARKMVAEHYNYDITAQKLFRAVNALSADK